MVNNVYNFQEAKHAAAVPRSSRYRWRRACVVPQALGCTEAASLPATFKRLVARQTGESFAEVAEVVELPLPTPGAGEVLLRVHYAGVNGGCETFRARGEHSFAANRGRRQFPLGAEGSGVVAAVGQGVRGLKVGDAVACNGAAAFSEFTLASAGLCQPVQRAGPEEAALALSAVTACVALQATAKAKAGETVLVTAAAGGTGQFAVQLAKQAGCRVVAVCGSEAKAEAARRLGADHAINYAQQELQDVLAGLCPGGVDVVYEGVGGRLQAALLQHLAPGGRMLQVGYISQYPHSPHSSSAPGPLAALTAAAQQQWVSSVPGATNADLFWQGAELSGPEGRRVIGQIWPKDLLTIRRCRKHVFELHSKGQLQVLIDSKRSFRGVDSIPEAVEYMLRGSHIGKVVVQLH